LGGDSNRERMENTRGIQGGFTAVKCLGEGIWVGRKVGFKKAMRNWVRQTGDF